jgi:hypothetical protein
MELELLKTVPFIIVNGGSSVEHQSTNGPRMEFIFAIFAFIYKFTHVSQDGLSFLPFQIGMT